MKKNNFDTQSLNLIFALSGIILFSSMTFCQSGGTGFGTGMGRGASTSKQEKPRASVERYYFAAFGVSGVYVRDENNGFSGEAGGYSFNQAKGVTYDVANEIQAFITLSISHSYVIRFRAPANSFDITVVRGVGNVNPTQKITYTRVLLPKGTEVKITLTPKGIGKLLFDGDGDRTFESEIAPSSPDAARQIRTITGKH